MSDDTFPQDLAGTILRAYDELDRAEKLRAEMAGVVVRADPEELLKPPWQRRGIEMGIPTGAGSSRLLQVSRETAMRVVDDHIAECRLKLAEASLAARKWAQP